jgi:hypothetical protein
VGLVIQVQRVGNQFFNIDLRRTFEAPSIAAAPVVPALAAITSAAFASTLWATPAWRTISAWAVSTWAISTRTAPFTTLTLPAAFPAVSLRAATFAARSLGRTIALRSAFRAIRLWPLGFGRRRGGFRSHRFAGRARRFGFGITCFLLCLLRISHPNLCIVR